MAKKEEVAEEVIQSNAPAVIENENGVQVSTLELLKQVEEASVGLELGTDYLKLEAGETVRVIFVEMTEMNGIGSQDGQMVEAVKLLGSDGRFKLNGDKVIVSTCRTLSQKGRKNVPLQIIHKGVAISKKGFKYADMQINELLIK